MFQNKKNQYGKYQCPCCGYYTFNEPVNNHFDICPVCFWEDDGVQLANPDYEGGANYVSLTQARKNFKEYGAVEKHFISSVRLPSNDEMSE